MIIPKINSRYHKYCKLTERELESYLLKNINTFDQILYPFSVWWRNKSKIINFYSFISYQRIKFNDVFDKTEKLNSIDKYAIEYILITQQLSLEDWQYLESKYIGGLSLNFKHCSSKAKVWEEYRKNNMFEPALK